jgi:hypothetical protein
MYKASPTVKLGVLVAVLAWAATLASAGSAMAAKMVVSDKVTFKGMVQSTGAFQAGIPGTIFTCKLTSDGEPEESCEASGIALGIGTSMIELETQWGNTTDGIGLTTVKAIVPRVASKPPTETYAGTIPCEEVEEETGVRENYPCQVQVRLAFNTAKNTVTGKYVVREESTQP